MDKELYYESEELIINGITAGRTVLYRTWHYGEIPNEVRIPYSDFDELFESSAVCDWFTIWRSSFGRRIKSDMANKTFTKKNFKKAEFIRHFCKVESGYSMDDLTKRLSAEDFIKYCKDHGLTVCPMN